MVFLRYLQTSTSYLSSGVSYFFTRNKTKENYMAESELALEPAHGRGSWLWSWLNWTRSDADMLKAAEKKILSYLKTAYTGRFVNIGPAGIGSTPDKIWTISLNEESNKTPILLLHGLASGVALWVLNLDSLAANRPVYAIDVLGFGRSSRPTLSSDALEVERQLVQSVEEWRKQMKLEKMILLGHSMGGFLAASYSIRYPERVKHLILADPWGFPERPDISERRKLPLVVKVVAYMLQPFNPLSSVRAAGPWGTWLIEKVRPDIIRKFAPLLNEDVNMVPQYIFQCNAQTPSGESAFHAMMSSFGWAKYPMINRMDSLRADIPITFVCGSRSWVDNSSGDKIKEYRAATSYVNVVVITGAGHHVYADKSDIFNRHVNEACSLSDRNGDVKQPEGNTPAASDGENSTDVSAQDQPTTSKESAKTMTATTEPTKGS